MIMFTLCFIFTVLRLKNPGDNQGPSDFVVATSLELACT